MRRANRAAFALLAVGLVLAACKPPAAATKSPTPKASGGAVVVYFGTSSGSDSMDSFYVEVMKVPGITGWKYVTAADGVKRLARLATPFPQAQNGNSKRDSVELQIADADEASRVVGLILQTPYLESVVPHPSTPMKDIGYIPPSAMSP